MKISLSEAQQLYFYYELDSFRSKLIMLGFNKIELPHIADKAFVYVKGKITIQMNTKPPADIRTWRNSRNLRIHDDFKIAMFAVINEDF